MEADKVKERKLTRLEALDEYKVADDDPDVRGWAFVGNDGSHLGVVDSLIVDQEAEKVRYLDVKLDKAFTHSDSDRHILVPIGLAKVHEDKDEVLLNEIDRSVLLDCPIYRGDGVTLDYEHALVEKLGTATKNNPFRGTIAKNPSDFYSYNYYDMESFYCPRRNKATEELRDIGKS